MKLTETEIAGVFDVALQPHQDQRGFFARIFCTQEFERAGLDFASPQINLSRNDHAYTLRGMHFQNPPHAEAKLVRVSRGAIFDVVVDLRPGQPTYLQHITRRLDGESAAALYIPEGCAHGFLTLEPDCDVIYQMSKSYVQGHAKGLRFDDPALKINWPQQPRVIAPADLAWPLL